MSKVWKAFSRKKQKYFRATLTRQMWEKKIEYVPFAWGGKQKDGSTWVFLEILGAVESSLGQLATFVRYPLPVRLADHKADRSLSIGVLLLFQVGPAYLGAGKGTGTSVTSLQFLLLRYYFTTKPRNDTDDEPVMNTPRQTSRTWLSVFDVNISWYRY